MMNQVLIMEYLLILNQKNSSRQKSVSVSSSQSPNNSSKRNNSDNKENESIVTNDMFITKETLKSENEYTKKVLEKIAKNLAIPLHANINGSRKPCTKSQLYEKIYSHLHEEK